MATAGLQPSPDPPPDPVRVPPERLAELDRLLAEGGIAAVIGKLKEEEKQ